VVLFLKLSRATTINISRERERRRGRERGKERDFIFVKHISWIKVINISVKLLRLMEREWRKQHKVVFLS
jgi:hypothetical protein